jgi:hypothetical protein
LDTYGSRVVYDASPSIGPKLSSIIRCGKWYWPQARSDDLVVIQRLLPDVEIGEVDHPVWASKSGEFSSAETWERLRERKPVVDWFKTIWFPAAIPRHAFFLWLAFHDALITREHMCRWGYKGDSLCLFCHSKQENRNHLFFECSLSKRIWTALMAECGVADPPVVWEDVSRWSKRHMRGKSLHVAALKLCLAASVYNLWIQRNLLLHSDTPRSEDALLSKIKWEVKVRLISKFVSK